MARPHGLIIFLIGLLVAASPASARTVIDRVSIAERSDGQGVIVRFHTQGPVQAFREPMEVARNHYELVIFNADLSASYTEEDPHGPIESIVANPDRGHLKFIIAVSEGVRVRASVYRDRASSDLLLGLEFQADAARVLPTAELPAPRRDESASASASASALRWKLDTIVIDPGHGGRDPGAMANGVREKDIALAVARKLGRSIEEELGVRVVYTRDDDRFIELKQRGRLANDAGGKLFISLHVNAAASSQAHGTETFFLGMHKSEAARDVMERENSVVNLESDPDQYSDMTDQALILQALAQSAFMRKSEELASLVEDAMDTQALRRSRGVRQAGFYVLWSASMPSILVELGFLTNPREAAFLSSDSGQEYLAEAILRAVEAFKERYERDLHLVGP